MKLEYTAKIDDNGKQIKDILYSKLNISHRLFITLKRNNMIFLNGCASPSYKEVKSR